MPNIVVTPKPLPNEVRKHIAAVHIAGELTTMERKLLNVLLLNAYDDIADKESHQIPITVLCAMIGWGESNNTLHLKQALGRLTTTKIEFDVLYNGEKEKKRKRWGVTATLAGAEFIDGVCVYEYSKILRRALANPEIYAIINIGVQKEFTGTYALALYENCVRFRNTNGHSTGFISVDLWRQLLGVGRDREGRIVPSAYDEFKHFNNQVIKPSVKEVNKISDIYVTPEYMKEGRNITAIKFTVEPNPQTSIHDIPRDDDATRQSEAYELLRKLDVSDRLAVEWISSEPDYSLHVARTTTDKFANSEVKNPAGYATVMMKNKPSDFVAFAESPAARKAIVEAARDDAEKVTESVADTRSAQTRAAVAALSVSERAAIAAQFIGETGSESAYDPVKDKVGGLVENRKFQDFKRTRAASVIAARAA